MNSDTQPRLAALLTRAAQLTARDFGPESEEATDAIEGAGNARARAVVGVAVVDPAVRWVELVGATHRRLAAERSIILNRAARLPSTAACISGPQPHEASHYEHAAETCNQPVVALSSTTGAGEQLRSENGPAPVTFRAGADDNLSTLTTCPTSAPASFLPLTLGRGPPVRPSVWRRKRRDTRGDQQQENQNEAW